MEGNSHSRLFNLGLRAGFLQLAFVALALIVLGAHALQFAYAAPEKLLNYQARVTNHAGEVISNGSYSVAFRIYNAPTGGSVLWQEDQRVTIENGILDVRLGLSRPLNLDFNTGRYYLGVRIGGDSELAPRRAIGASPFALNSSLLDGRPVGSSSNNILALDSNSNLNLPNSLMASNTIEAGSAITIGNISVGANGRLRFTGEDFEGFFDGTWHSLTASSEPEPIDLSSYCKVNSACAGYAPAVGSTVYANRQLNNLTGVAINSGLLPNVNNALDLGSSSLSWNNNFSSYLVLSETTTPSAIANFGKLYVKSADSTLYFQDDAGVEHNLLVSGAGNVIGAGAVNQVTYWTGASTVAGSNDFMWNGTELAIVGNGAFTGTLSANTLTLSNPLTVANGGTGLNALTANGVLLGNGASAINVTSAPTAGQVLLGNNSGVPTFTTITGDISINGDGVVTVVSSGDFANRELSNLEVITAINTDLLPDTNDVHNLGSDTLRWNALYIGPSEDEGVPIGGTIYIGTGGDNGYTGDAQIQYADRTLNLTNYFDSETTAASRISIGDSFIDFFAQEHTSYGSFEDDAIPILQISSRGDLIQGNKDTYLFDGATAGFMYIAGINGTPVGIPNAFGDASGKVPFTYDVTSDTLYFYNSGWQAFGSSDNFATRELDNLRNTAINTDLLPDTDNAHSLGSNTLRWKDLYIGSSEAGFDMETIHIGESLVNEGTIHFYKDSGEFIFNTEASGGIKMGLGYDDVVNNGIRVSSAEGMRMFFGDSFIDIDSSDNNIELQSDAVLALSSAGNSILDSGSQLVLESVGNTVLDSEAQIILGADDNIALNSDAQIILGATDDLILGSDQDVYLSSGAATVLMQDGIILSLNDNSGSFLLNSTGVQLNSDVLASINAPEVQIQGSLVQGAGLATNATDGFFYLSSTAGTPTGTPTTHSGTVAMTYDTANDLLYFYNAGWQVLGDGGSGDFATRELDNLQDTAINTDLLPDTNDVHNLGSSSLRWNALYIGPSEDESPPMGTIHIGESSENEGTIRFYNDFEVFVLNTEASGGIKLGTGSEDYINAGLQVYANGSIDLLNENFDGFSVASNSDAQITAEAFTLNADGDISIWSGTDKIEFDSDSVETTGSFYAPNMAVVGNTNELCFDASTGQIGDCGSDRTLKENISYNLSGLTIVNQLKPAKFDWKNGRSGQTGFIAQDVQMIIPNAVSATASGHLSLNSSQLLPFVVKATQELDLKVVSIQEEVSGLNLQVANLKAEFNAIKADVAGIKDRVESLEAKEGIVYPSATNLSVSDGAQELVVEWDNPVIEDDYSVFVTPNWNAGFWIADKNPTSFVIQFTNPAPEGAKLDYKVEK